MNILLITSSARGHAIADALARSHHAPDIIACSPSRNPGIRPLAGEQHVIDIMDFDAVLAVAARCNPAFAFIGPDDPIGAGLADRLEEEGIPCIAPKGSLARIESSKGFARTLLQKHNIDASPLFRVFVKADASDIQSYIENELEGNYVVKYDGLKGGKGVKVSGEHLHSVAEGVAYACECIDECGQAVIEEKLIGVEFSLMSFVSGEQIAHMPAVQDHKRAYAGDTGPNTGGMGTYSDANHALPFLSESDLQSAKELNLATAKALLQECGEPFRGILYGGFIAVKNGVRLIEYNARFGDPEALNVLPLLSTDFIDVCHAMIQQDLSEDSVHFEQKATVCKYITPDCYPESKDRKGDPVTFPAITGDARIFYGDLSEEEDGTLRLGGSRSAGIVGIGDTIAEAEKSVESLCNQVQGPVRFRSDIGTQEVIDQRIEMMRKLRPE